MLKTRFISGLAVTAFLAPQLMFAATPQQMLDQAVRLAVEHPVAQHMSVDFTVDGSFKPSRGLSRRDIESSGARIKASTFQLRLVIDGEAYPHADAMGSDGQGRIRLVKVTSTGEPAINLSNLASLEWKSMGDVFYIRIADVSSELRAYLQQTGMEISALNSAVGTWLKIDPQSLASAIQNALPMSGAATISAHSTSDFEQLARALPIFQLVKVEKQVKQGAQTYTRLSVRLHPGFWTRLDQALAKSIDADLQDLKAISPKEYTKQRAIRLASMRKSLKETRTSAAKLRLVLMINNQSGRIERAEGAWQDTTPSRVTVYRGDRSVKLVEGQETVQVHFTSSLQTTPVQTIQEPTPFVTLESLVQSFMSSMMGGGTLPEESGATGTVTFTP